MAVPASALRPGPAVRASAYKAAIAPAVTSLVSHGYCVVSLDNEGLGGFLDARHAVLEPADDPIQRLPTRDLLELPPSADGARPAGITEPQQAAAAQVRGIRGSASRNRCCETFGRMRIGAQQSVLSPPRCHARARSPYAQASHVLDGVGRSVLRAVAQRWQDAGTQVGWDDADTCLPWEVPSQLKLRRVYTAGWGVAWPSRLCLALVN